jgi:hypothetical protein
VRRVIDGATVNRATGAKIKNVGEKVPMQKRPEPQAKLARER